MTDSGSDRIDPDHVLFQDWLDDFANGKQLVGTSDQSDTFAIHSIKRYIDQHGKIWEVALTYTGRVVTRSGDTAPDLSVSWSDWKTLHQVIVKTPTDGPS
ncbi:MAG TPA: hypothetical protein VE954_23050 [Oligoflexus sp.]|uniref:hypothetical protein n=1 Tax=Oligoflexus sp. TaxID=1971216 RepID=UPI002D246B2F|nr:hypothetical protein [Oligoflexus sp.]HYX35990.1 hypothetical protein [Oligoflexus sp.]